MHPDRPLHIDFRKPELYRELSLDGVVLLFARTDSQYDEHRKKRLPDFIMDMFYNFKMFNGLNDPSIANDGRRNGVTPPMIYEKPVNMRANP